jgi:hypothetical protein
MAIKNVLPRSLPHFVVLLKSDLGVKQAGLSRTSIFLVNLPGLMASLLDKSSCLAPALGMKAHA